MKLSSCCFAVLLSFLFSSCKLNHKEKLVEFETIEPVFRTIINSSAESRVICEGFDWCEGPVWIADEKMLLFSDVPKNRIYKWTEEGGKQLYLSPSGYTGTLKRGGELGSNGLAIDNQGKLIICQHGDRRVARMDSPISSPTASFTTIADNYLGKKFDSPNDLVVAANGDIYFTDPPYGLEKNTGDPLKEMARQGVYRISATGKVTLLTDTISRPNGIALTPDGKTLFIASSDSLKAAWFSYELGAGDSLTHGKLIFDATGFVQEAPGLPDGMKVDKAGNIFATGPGGIWVFDKKFKLLGKIHLKGLASNCTFADDDRTLYITSNDKVIQVKMR
ncbi:MAG: SMP-30/gluconolactonase/LRE family protein [Chitinophagaceae bacterium]